MQNESGARLDGDTKIKNKARILILPLLFNSVLDVLAREIRKKKKVVQIRKEVKRSLFPDDMILYIENPQESTNKLLELVNKFRKVSRLKDQLQKSFVF